jgi:hypothetical protein
MMYRGAQMHTGHEVVTFRLPPIVNSTPTSVAFSPYSRPPAPMPMKSLRSSPFRRHSSFGGRGPRIGSNSGTPQNGNTGGSGGAWRYFSPGNRIVPGTAVVTSSSGDGLRFPSRTIAMSRPFSRAAWSASFSESSGTSMGASAVVSAGIAFSGSSR